jgi:hypothetical protein
MASCAKLARSYIGWPLEGHFVVGGSGLYVSTACLGRAFPSRTASYDLTIGLPQFEMDSTPREVLRALGMPPNEHSVSTAHVLGYRG